MTGCKVTLPSSGVGKNEYPCGQPVVNTASGLCIKHEADRIRLGGKP